MTELLYQMFLVVLCGVGIFVIIALIQVIMILLDVKHVSIIASKRITQADKFAQGMIDSLKDVRDVVKGFALSLDFLKGIKEAFIENKNKEKGDK